MQDFLALCAFLACIFALGAAIVALFKPLPRLGMANRKQTVRGFGASFVLLILFIILIPKPDSVPPEEEQATVEASAPTQADAGISLTTGEFIARFNALAKQADKPWKIERLDNESSLYSYEISDNFAFSGALNSEDDIRNLIVVASGDGSLESGAEAFLGMTVIYCAVNGIADLKKCGSPVLELMQSFTDGGEAAHSILNGRKFSYSRNEIVGNMLTIDPVKE